MGWKTVDMGSVFDDIFKYCKGKERDIEAIWLISPYVTYLDEHGPIGYAELAEQLYTILNGSSNPKTLERRIRVATSGKEEHTGKKADFKNCKVPSINVEILDQMRKNGSDVRLKCSLHTKIYGVKLKRKDEGIMWIGSANATKNSFKSHEVLTRIDTFTEYFHNQLLDMWDDVDCHSDFQPCDCTTDLDDFLDTYRKVLQSRIEEAKNRKKAREMRGNTGTTR
ncbi:MULTISPECIES: hypothetical protein [Deinococcus]|uniref:Phospholipase D-like domain-containing protein n=1 Tax=Deinococcus rufus TaxID=2136097 RepID=A0ABV7ZAK5_9DEIO|nr:hypothetical protein [Deinococcus sp. AB2017081]WQE94661.1 hypothetical protein U2P90_14795 [Deinococcus sp. AB2017081]